MSNTNRARRKRIYTKAEVGVLLHGMSRAFAQISDEQWESFTDNVLRKLAQEPTVSRGTRMFARDLLTEREARLPKGVD